MRQLRNVDGIKVGLECWNVSLHAPAHVSVLPCRICHNTLKGLLNLLRGLQGPRQRPTID